MTLTDGVVRLRPITHADGPAMIAGEDAEITRWLTGAPATPASTTAYLDRVARWWAEDGPHWCFGIRLAADDTLTGTIDAQTGLDYLGPDQANLSYCLYPAGRGRGLATRAVALALDHLRARPTVREVVIRTDPANLPSAAVARRAGFAWTHRTDDQHGLLDWYGLTLVR